MKAARRSGDERRGSPTTSRGRSLVAYQRVPDPLPRPAPGGALVNDSEGTLRARPHYYGARDTTWSQQAC